MSYKSIQQLEAHAKETQEVRKIMKKMRVKKVRLESKKIDKDHPKLNEYKGWSL